MPTRAVFKSEFSGIASPAFAGLALPEMLLPMGPSFGLTSGFNAGGCSMFQPTNGPYARRETLSSRFFIYPPWRMITILA